MLFSRNKRVQHHKHFFFRDIACRAINFQIIDFPDEFFFSPLERVNMKLRRIETFYFHTVHNFFPGIPDFNPFTIEMKNIDVWQFAVCTKPEGMIYIAGAA